MATKDMKTTSLVPKLRFPGFREDWQRGAIGDLFISEDDREKATAFESDKIITVKLHANGVVRNERTGALTGGASYFKRRAGQFIFSKIDLLNGAFGIVPTELDGFYSSSDVPAFSFNDEHSPPFFLNWLTANYERLEIERTGTSATLKRVSPEKFRALPILLPSPTEQRKIAACLTSLDALIAARGRKVAALADHKRGLMQQLFPREGETLPCLRFPEFLEEGGWEVKTLDDIAHIASGTTPLRANPEFYEGGTIPWVKTTDLNNSFIETTEECITGKAKATVNPVGSVLVAMYGGFKQIGRTGYLKIPAATNQALSVLRTKGDDLLPIYLLAWLNAKVEIWKGIASSSRKDPNITGSDVARFPIAFPKPAEQQRIAACLGTLDAAVAAEAQTLAALRTHKKGLMQQLFPSAQSERTHGTRQDEQATECELNP